MTTSLVVVGAGGATGAGAAAGTTGAATATGTAATGTAGGMVVCWLGGGGASPPPRMRSAPACLVGTRRIVLLVADGRETLIILTIGGG